MTEARWWRRWFGRWRVPDVVICAIAKNEGAYLKEWAAFHLAIGFDRIVIYDNESEDGSADLFCDGRWHEVVEIVPWPTIAHRSPQRDAYQHFVETRGAKAGWIAFIDIDEFINLKRHASIRQFLASYRDCDAIGINWRMFGSSGATEHEPGLVIDRFRRAAVADFEINKHIKTIARPRSIHRADVHNSSFGPGTRFVGPDHVARDPACNAWQAHIDLETVQINHYFTKSRAEFAQKRARGRADLPANDAARFRGEAEFDTYDRDEIEDISIGRWRTALLRKIVELDRPR